MLFRLYESDACCKVDPTVVEKSFRNMAIDVAKGEALKTNISIRVKGFVWKDLHITWTHQRVKRPLVELDNQLRKVIIFGEKMAFIQSLQPRSSNKHLC